MCEWDMVAPLEVITAYNFANSTKVSGGYEPLLILLFVVFKFAVCIFSVSSNFSVSSSHFLSLS